MYLLTDEQLLSIPFDDRDDNLIVQRLIRLSVESKRKNYPELWGESTDERPIINIRTKFDGVITGGDLNFFMSDLFITVKYLRLHSVNIERYKTNAGDGKYEIEGMWVGTSPYPEHRRWVRGWAFNHDHELYKIYDRWNALEMRRYMEQ